MILNNILKFLFLLLLLPYQTVSAKLGSERFTCPDKTNPACGSSTTNPNSLGSQLEALKQQIANTGVPVGSIITSAYNGCPDGTIKADGQLTSSYPELAALMGSVPDLRGEFIRGFDDGRGVDGGRIFDSTQSGQNKSHEHLSFRNTAVRSHSNIQSGQYPVFRGGNPGGGNDEYKIEGTNLIANIGRTSKEGGTETRPRNVALLYCIVTGA